MSCLCFRDQVKEYVLIISCYRVTKCLVFFKDQIMKYVLDQVPTECMLMNLGSRPMPTFRIRSMNKNELHGSANSINFMKLSTQ